MAKKHYRFNPESISFDQVEHNLMSRFKKIFGYLLSSFIIATLLLFVLSKFINIPHTRQVERENKRLLAQYNLMNKELDQMQKVLEDIQQRDDKIYRIILEAEPIPNSIRKAGFGGVNRYSELENMKNSELVIETSRKLDILSKKLYVQSKSFDEVKELALNKEMMLAHLPAIQPVSNKDLKRTASGWGWRIDPIYKVRRFHYGMDFSAPKGTEIYATADGKVKEVKTFRSGYGKHIIIDHGFGYKTLYAHLKGFKAKKGQKVKRGEVIGYVGNTGKSTGPHLHYEVHKNGKKVNPQYYYFKDLTPLEYEKMIQLSSNTGQTFD